MVNSFQNDGTFAAIFWGEPDQPPEVRSPQQCPKISCTTVENSPQNAPKQTKYRKVDPLQPHAQRRYQELEIPEQWNSFFPMSTVLLTLPGSLFQDATTTTRYQCGDQPSV